MSFLAYISSGCVLLGSLITGLAVSICFHPCRLPQAPFLGGVESCQWNSSLAQFRHRANLRCAPQVEEDVVTKIM